MKRIPTLFVTVVAAAALGAAGAPAASAAATHPAAVQKTPPKCVRGHLHKNGHRDCGLHKGAMNKGGTNSNKGTSMGNPAPGGKPTGG
jgi:hypothetical protein